MGALPPGRRAAPPDPRPVNPRRRTPGAPAPQAPGGPGDDARSGPGVPPPPPVPPAAAGPPPAWPELAVPASALPGVGAARSRQLADAGLHTVEQVLRHLPRRHEDRSRPARLGEIREPGTYTAAATVLDARESRPRPGLTLLQARLTDGGAILPAVWFNQGYLRRVLVPGARVMLHGRVAPDRGGRLAFRAPEVEAVRGGGGGAAGGGEAAPTGLLPVYPPVAGLAQRTLRTVVHDAVRGYADLIPDTVPPHDRARLGLMPASAAWRGVHMPASAAELEEARRSIVFEEIFHLQLGLLIRRQERAGALRGFRTAPAGDLTRRFLAGLPYRLTGAQRRVLQEIDADLAEPRPMYRLVQGDVGSGKTVVAAAAMLRAAEGGHQAALLAPTEILAEQHIASLRRLYGPLCRAELLTGSTPRAARRQLLGDLESGRIAVLVGTHALLEPEVRFASLGLAATDEQHRFGVRQRDALAAKGASPDVLVLTATPIPRTLAMTLYGDLDVSVIDELPPGRRPVRTFTRPPASRGPVYAFVRELVRGGRQAYVVCPLIADPVSGDPAPEAAEGDAPLPDPPDPPDPPDGEASAAAAESWAERLASEMPDVRVALLHGRMPPAAKEEVMARFAAGEIQLLVATTVIEVGVDVPNAAAMVVEDADRFGLAQLHQLRGRVGRGPHASYCILIARGALARLEILTRTSDGFAIAEEDLRQRGPGEVMGTRQHGLPELALADPVHDGALLQDARDAARAVLASDPRLESPGHAHLRTAVEALFGRPRG